MILKQLKQLALSAPLRNARLARFYGSPALCESLTTSKVRTRLSRDDRRALVESFVNDYRETNAGKFPTLQVIHKEVGGSYYVIRDIFQELKLKPKASVPIVAKALSEVSLPLPNDASSQTLNDPQSHSSACDAEHLSPVVVDTVFQDGSPDTIETESDQRRAAVDSSHPNPEESNLQGNNLVIPATDDKRETEIAPNSDIDSKLDSNTHLPETQKGIVSVECLENSETEEEENLTHSGSQESKEENLEGAAVSANGVPTENRQLSKRGDGEVKTEERSSAWSNIMSFAKEFANFWRKG
ncbi:hypothetical protein V5N11_004730 [Cardamine amara subsp. amara]|uniref:AT3G52170-like helix-turn-helix domain-containing protein n=1 Tax=Cardamine amara subsp. amara TaxID=228776 RepID=A0ABD1BK62_CARAN